MQLHPPRPFLSNLVCETVIYSPNQFSFPPKHVSQPSLQPRDWPWPRGCLPGDTALASPPSADLWGDNVSLAIQWKSHSRPEFLNSSRSKFPCPHLPLAWTRNKLCDMPLRFRGFCFTFYLSPSFCSPKRYHSVIGLINDKCTKLRGAKESILLPFIWECESMHRCAWPAVGIQLIFLLFHNWGLYK